MSSLKKVFLVELKNFRIPLYSVLATYVFSLLLSFGICHWGDLPDYFPISAIFTPIASLFSLLALIIGAMMYDFSTAVKFSITRKSFLLNVGILYTALIPVLLGLCFLLYKLEMLIYPLFFPNLPLEIIAPFSIFLKSTVFSGIGILVLGFVIGAAFQRFGTKALWAFWGLYMIFFIVIMPKFEVFLRTGVDLKLLAFIGIAVSVILLIVSVWSLLKQEIRG